MAKRNKLSHLTIEELSVCRKGVNQKADILITKAEVGHMKENPVEKFTKALKGLLSMAVTGKDSEGNVLKSEEEQLALVTKGVSELEAALNAEVPVDKGGKLNKGDDFDMDDLDDDEDDDVAKAAIEEAIAKADERVAKAESVAREALKKAEALTKAAERLELQKQVESVTKAFPVNLNEVTDVLASLPADQRDKFLSVLKSADATATQALLTSTIGKGQAPKHDAETQLETLAKAKAKESNVSFAKAYTEVCVENPGLYAEVQRAHGLSR